MAESLPFGSMMGKIFLRSSPKSSTDEHGLAGAHPVDVAAQGVDLAVVHHVAVGVGTLPAREGVSAEAGVDQGHGVSIVGVGQVGEELLHLVGQQHSLVDQRSAGEAGDIEVVAAWEPALLPDRVLGPAADHVELSLKGHFVGNWGRGR